MRAPAAAAAAKAEVDIPGGDEAHPVADEMAEPADLAGDLEPLPDKEIDRVCSAQSQGSQVQRYLGGKTLDLDATEATLFVLSIGPMAAEVDEGYLANCLYDPAEVHPTEVRQFQGWRGSYCLAVPLAGVEGGSISLSEIWLLLLLVLLLVSRFKRGTGLRRRLWGSTGCRLWRRRLVLHCRRPDPRW